MVSTYLLSAERGYLLLPAAVRSELNLTHRTLGLRADDACLATRWAGGDMMGWVLDFVVGFDTVVVHGVAAAGMRGYLARSDPRPAPRAARTPAPLSPPVASELSPFLRSV